MNQLNQEELFFIGGLFPKEKESEIRECTKSGLQNAANNLQWKFIRGFDEVLGSDRVHILNSEYIGSFPFRYKKLIIPRFNFSHAGDVPHDIDTGFLNLPILKELSRAASLKREIDRLPNAHGNKVYFVGYAATYPIVDALLYAKRKYPDSVCCLIVPDLPQYMELGQKEAGSLRKIKNNVVNRKMRAMDCYVPLTAAMAPFLGADMSRCVVVEGIAEDIPEGSDSDSKECPTGLFDKYVLYTGTLQYRYGIGELLSAFEQLEDEKVGLVLCGEGEAVDEIRALEAKDPRVRYLGMLSSDEIAALRAGASILVNPRRNEDEYTKFSFPSKMMEYLVSGVPTIAYRLDGMPDDYMGLFFDATEMGLRATIELVLSMDESEIAQFADRTRNYIINKKNPKAQCERVLALLRGMAG